MNYDIVQIDWYDSQEDPGWVESKAIDAQDTIVHSVGWLVEETETTVTITTSFDKNHKISPLTIPKVCILDRWKIEIHE